MSMNGDNTPQDDTLRQARLATEALAADMARAIIEASQQEGEGQVNFIASHLIRLHVQIGELRAMNALLQEKLNEQSRPKPGDNPPVEVVNHPQSSPHPVQ